MGDGQSMSRTKKALIGLGIVAAGVLAYQLLTTTSEEPPIRVKKGSMDLDVVTTRANSRKEDWKMDDAQGKAWSPTGSRENSHQLYQLTWDTSATCPSAFPTQARRVRVWHSGTWVDIQHQTKRTKLNASGRLSKTTDPRRIRHEGLAGTGIDKVEVWPNPDGSDQWTCTFAPDKFKAICLCDGACEPDCLTAQPRP